MTTISAVITTYKRPETFSRALGSVCQQLQPPDEIIVIDNAGDQAVADLVSSCARDTAIPIHYVHETKRGVSCARNRGIKEASSDYIAFLDDDDIWSPAHLQLFRESERLFGNLALFGGLVARYGDATKVITPNNPEMFKEFVFDPTQQYLIRKQSRIESPFFTPPMSTSIISATFVPDALFDESLIGREDILFTWLLGEKGDIVIHKHVHGFADQLEISLFSVSSQADESQSLAMDLKKAQCGVLMMEKLFAHHGGQMAPAMKRTLSAAYFGSAYFNSKSGNTALAFSHLLKSMTTSLSLRHFKLMLRLMLNSLKHVLIKTWA